MKILVTGAGSGGFIGGYLVEELKRLGNEVLTLSNSAGSDYVADITDRKMMFKIIPGFDVVYHLAGLLGTSELVNQSYKASEVNILGTINILDAANWTKTKVVHITKPNVWLNTYSITKQAAEDFGKMYFQEFGLPVVSVKWFNVYGPGQSFHCQKAVPYFIRWALNGEDIQVWGDGEQTMDLVHARDAVKGLIAVANEDSLLGQTVDVGTGKQTTVNELAEMIVRKTGSKSKIVHLPMRAGETPNTLLGADTTVLDSIGFKCTEDLEAGLEETIEFYRND